MRLADVLEIQRKFYERPPFIECVKFFKLITVIQWAIGNYVTIDVLIAQEPYGDDCRIGLRDEAKERTK